MPPANLHSQPARTRIKICGIRDINGAMSAADAGADSVGFVFVEGSPRCVTVDAAAKIVAGIPAFVEPVALFVDASAPVIRQTCASTGIRTVQLHGHESREFAQSLSGLRIIKAINWGDERQSSWLATDPPAGVVGLLVDAPVKAAAAGGLTGGGGDAFDWTILASLERPRTSLILAGGLTPENVGRAIATVRPYAVDVSSGVESSRGVKDPARVRAFCDAVRRADGARG